MCVLGQRSQQEIGLVTRFPTPNEMMVFMVKRNETKQNKNQTKTVLVFRFPGTAFLKLDTQHTFYSPSLWWEGLSCLTISI